jgi:hypothetical protein
MRTRSRTLPTVFATILAPLAGVVLAAWAGASTPATPWASIPKVLIQDEQASPQGLWREVVLVDGFHLDLRSGQVEAGGEPGESLLFNGEQLIAQPRLSSWTPVEMPGPTTVIRKGGGDAVDDPVPLPGEEYLFDLGGGDWGYLQILDRRTDAIRIEIAVGPKDSESLTRDPARLFVSAEPSHHRLTWVPESDEARYAVERWVHGTPDGFVEIARVPGGEFLDASAPAGRVVEYRVGRVFGDTDLVRLGARAHSLRQERPGDWPIRLIQGMTLNLLSGETDAGDEGHLEVSLAQGSSLHLKTLGEVAIYGPERDDQRPGGAWIAPQPWVKGYQTKVRRASRGDAVYYVAIPDGSVVRLSVTEEDGGLALRRQIDLSGTLRFPQPPVQPELNREPDGVTLVFPDLPESLGLRNHAAIVVERERAPGDQVWQEFTVSAPSQRTVNIGQPWDPSVEFLVRLRFRHRLPGLPDSPASAPTEFLTFDPNDDTELRRALDYILSDLGHEEFGRRQGARVLLESLGDFAWPRLEAILVGDETASIEVQTVVRELLLGDPGGRSLPLVLRARAAEEGVTVDAPEGLLNIDVHTRMLAMLRAHGQPGGAPWTRVLALSDPDPGVKKMAEILLAAHEVPRLMDPEAQTIALVPPDQRRAPKMRDWRWAVEEGDPQEVAAWARDTIDLDHPRAAQIALMVAYRLELAGPPWTLHGDLRQNAELALRLVDAARMNPGHALLDAAEALIATPATQLRARRDLLDQRFSQKKEVQRERFELESADIGSLTALLNDLHAQGASYIDVVLAPGVYEDESLGPWLQLHIDGLRLIGGEGVTLKFGLQLEGVVDVVLQNLVVHSDRSNALLLRDGASAVVQGCHLIGVQTVVSLSQSRLEVDASHIDSDPARPAALGIRMNGGSELNIRCSLVTAGTARISTGDHVYLDRTLFDAGARVLGQGSPGGSIVARSTMMVGRAQGFINLDDLLLEGVVMDVPRDILINVPGARMCPDTVRTVDPSVQIPAHAVLGTPILGQ